MNFDKETNYYFDAESPTDDISPEAAKIFELSPERAKYLLQRHDARQIFFCK